MKTLCAGIVALAFSSQSFAQPLPSSDATAVPSISLSRAEVLADLALWRQAGLSDAALREVHSGNALRRQSAMAHYQRLRASERYAELVGQLSDGAGAVQTAH